MPAITPIRLLWLGNVQDEANMLSGPAISPAANRWQAGLLRGLEQAGSEIRLLGHRAEPVWPRGMLRTSRNEGQAPVTEPTRILQIEIAYWNLPRLRAPLLSRQYVRAFHRILQDGFRPDAVLCYNVYPHSLATGHEAMRLSIPWIPVIADAPGDPAEYARLKQHLSEAAGCVFLPWSLYCDWSGSPKLHLDGGVEFVPEHEVDPPSSRGPRIVFYSGSLNHFGGIELLLDAFVLIRDPNVQLWVCGKGENAKLRQVLATDTRVTFFGCVPEEKLRGLSRQAHVMINPRPSTISGNQSNFPSKVMEYLSYAKPVISTWTSGLAPEYRQLVTVPDSETPAALAASIREVLEWEAVCREAHATKVADFLRQYKTWYVQGDRLVEWLKRTDWALPVHSQRNPA